MMNNKDPLRENPDKLVVDVFIIYAAILLLFVAFLIGIALVFG